MLSHCFVCVNDFPRGLRFYQAVMAALGHEQRFIEPDRPWAGWQAQGQPRPQYHPNYFGAYLRDPDGNKIGIACHAEEAG